MNNYKKYLIVAVAILILLIPQYTNRKEALNTYLYEYFQNSDDILTIQYVRGGAYVFKGYEAANNQAFYFDKTFLGWTYDYDVTHASLTPIIDQCGFSITEMDNAKSANQDLIFGKVIDPSIEKMMMKNDDTGEQFVGKVIESNGIKTWYMVGNDFKVGDYTLNAYDGNGEVVSYVKLTPSDLIFVYYGNRAEDLEPMALSR